MYNSSDSTHTAFNGSTIPRRTRRFSSARHRSIISVLPEYIQRLVHANQMDFQHACSQMVNLCLSPQSVYRSTRLHKEIKNQWARDDPAFVAILLCFMTVSSVSFSIAFGFLGVFHFFRLVTSAVLIDFVASGLLISTFSWWLSNNYMRDESAIRGEVTVEWLYAFDVHCNAFFPLFVLMYVVQFYLSPLLLSHSFAATFIANTMYAAAFGHYHYVSFLGFSALSFLKRAERFLYPIRVIVVLYILSLIMQINLSRAVLSWYFAH